MTTFLDAINLETGKLFRVEWWPEDTGIDRDPMRTYVIANSMNEAGAKLSGNSFDIKAVTYLGGVVERRPSEVFDAIGRSNLRKRLKTLTHSST